MVSPQSVGGTTVIGETGEDAEFAGICHTLDYALYDLSYHLRTMVGIPEGIPFPSKNIVMAEVETAISSQLVALIMSDQCKIRTRLFSGQSSQCIR